MTDIKLADLLDIMADDIPIIVWTEEDIYESPVPTFCGLTKNCPYRLSKMIVYKGLDDGDFGIDLRQDNGKGFITFSVTEEKNID